MQTAVVCHKDAERMPGGVSVDSQRLTGIIEAVPEQTSTEGQGSLMLSIELLCRVNSQVEVQLLGDRPLGPGRLCQLGHLLERQPAFSSGVQQH
jgi:hypothetical protein